MPATQIESTAAVAASLSSDGATKSRFELNFFSIGRIDKPDRGERCQSKPLHSGLGKIGLNFQATKLQPGTGVLSYDFDLDCESVNSTSLP